MVKGKLEELLTNQGTIDQAYKFPDVFKKTDFDIENAWLEIHEFESNLSDYIVGDIIISNRPIKGTK